MNLNYIAQIYGMFGIPIHSREFLRALLKRPELSISTLPLSSAKDDYDLTDDIKKSMGRPLLDDNSFIFFYPEVFGEWNFAKFNVGYYIFEWTKIPSLYVESINSNLDLICVASKWARDVLIQNKVSIPIEVVHGGVDTEYFTPAPNPLDYKDPFKFRFLNIGKAEERKGTDTLIRAFKMAFGDSDSVELVLSVDNIFTRLKGEQYVKDFLRRNGLNDNNIKCTGFIDDIRNLYYSCDCAVFATKAEGIGLPIVESLACGLPTITPVHTGITEFASTNILIPVRNLVEEPIYDPHFFPNKGEHGVWYAPKVEELAALMVEARLNKEENKVLGQRAAKWIQENYTWDLAAEQFINILGRKGITS